MRVKQGIVVLLIGLWAAPATLAQEASSQQPAEQQQKEKTTPEEKAVALLEQVISEAQSLRLPENRVRVQIAGGDLLWDRNEGRARALFTEAAAAVAEMMRNIDSNDRQYFNLIRVPSQLRQELLLTVARHDSTLAYQLLQTTRQPEPPANANARNGRGPNSEANLEQNLMTQIAASDPKLALRNAEELLSKGQYPNSLARVLAQLQLKDKDAAAQFSEKLLKQLQSENLLAKQDASSLALSLLRPGPLPANAPADAAKADPSNTAQANSAAQVLSEAAFSNLLETVIAAALKATPQTANNLGGQNNPRGGQNNPRGGQNGFRGGPNNQQTPLTDEQIQQNNARGMLMGLQTLLPQIDQYLPTRAAAVRQKLTEMGVGNDPRLAFGQINNLVQQGTTESLAAAAAAAPPGMQSSLYQQAAFKALDDGNPDRARQIANEHLDPSTRGVVLQTADLEQAALKAGAGKLEEVRQALFRLPSDEERVKMLLQLSSATQKSNPKLALQLLDEARPMVTRRASNYKQFDAQLKVAHAIAALDPAHSFEVLEPGISQLNELLSAAALLSGFEVDIFKDGELPIQGGSTLASTVTRYGQELAALAKGDFERAQTAADKFQLTEPRILTRLTIVRGVLGVQPVTIPGNGFGGRGFGQPPFGQNAPSARRPQQ